MKMKKLVAWIMALTVLFTAVQGMAEQKKDGTKKTNGAGVTHTATQTDLFIAETVPIFSEMFQEFTVKVRKKSDGSAVDLRLGPGKEYESAGTYVSDGKHKFTVYFVEDGWALMKIKDESAEEKFVYVKTSDLKGLDSEVPEVETLKTYRGVVTGTTYPVWGPSSQFHQVVRYEIPKNTAIEVYFQENGYVYAEFIYEDQLVRMWLPADQVRVERAKVTLTNETKKPVKTSVWGMEDRS